MIYLVAVLALVALEAFTLFLWQKDRTHMLNAVIARNPAEFKRLEKSSSEKDLDHQIAKFNELADEVPFGLNN